jgi:hypothetical protein
MKICNNTIGNRTRDLPVCSTVPQLRHRGPWYVNKRKKFWRKRLKYLVAGASFVCEEGGLVIQVCLSPCYSLMSAVYMAVCRALALTNHRVKIAAMYGRRILYLLIGRLIRFSDPVSIINND